MFSNTSDAVSFKIYAVKKINTNRKWDFTETIPLSKVSSGYRNLENKITSWRGLLLKKNAIKELICSLILARDKIHVHTWESDYMQHKGSADFLISHGMYFASPFVSFLPFLSQLFYGLLKFQTTCCLTFTLESFMVTTTDSASQNFINKWTEHDKAKMN